MLVRKGLTSNRSEVAFKGGETATRDEVAGGAAILKIRI
jgi:hypothetical protein